VLWRRIKSQEAGNQWDSRTLSREDHFHTQVIECMSLSDCTPNALIVLQPGQSLKNNTD
jgi:hypothetical protein